MSAEHESCEDAYDFAGTVDCGHRVTLQTKVHECTGTSRQQSGFSWSQTSM